MDCQKSSRFPPDPILEMGAIIRSHLEPLWLRLHEADARRRQSAAGGSTLPEILSTAMCRHSSEFARRALAAVGSPGWAVMRGIVPRTAMKLTPFYARSSAGCAEHFWLEDGAGGFLDITLDQFGFAPVVTNKDNTPAENGFKAARRNLTSISGTLRCWEGDPQARWWPEQLEIIRLSYNGMLAKLRAVQQEQGS